ncbi:MAG: antibiotic biosynthesis monooxygenase [Oligoflexia bacterium]|nr:antibiotic biosynthesis monooxygenase [Oligoflexia bacterium]
MTKSNLTVVAIIRARPGLEATVRHELQALIKPTRAEAGCINYDLHESTTEPGLFMFHENWQSEKALQDHLSTPHLKALQAKSEELFAEPVALSLWRALA